MVNAKELNFSIPKERERAEFCKPNLYAFHDQPHFKDRVEILCGFADGNKFAICMA